MIVDVRITRSLGVLSVWLPRLCAGMVSRRRRGETESQTKCEGISDAVVYSWVRGSRGTGRDARATPKAEK
jgi:hypothetical protein